MRASPKKYVAARGAPISEAEAQITGEAIEKCREKFGHIDKEVFRSFCQNPKEPVHAVFKKECERLAGGIEDQAASNLLRWIKVVHEDTGLETRAVIMIPMEHAEDEPEESEGHPQQGFTPEQIVESPDTKAAYDKAFYAQVFGMCKNYVAVRGLRKLSETLMAILAVFQADCEPKSEAEDRPRP